MLLMFFIFFFKQKTAYEMRISDWSSDVCSSDLGQQSRYVSMPSTLTVNNTETYEAACIAGLGIIQVPLMGMRHLLQAKVLLEILPDHLPAPMPISILYQNRRQVPTRVRVFMDWLAELISRHAMEP